MIQFEIFAKIFCRLGLFSPKFTTPEFSSWECWKFVIPLTRGTYQNDPQRPVYDSEFLSFGVEKGMHGVCSSLVYWGSLRTKVVVRSLNPTQPFSWICLRWVFTDCTMVNHHQTTNLGKYFWNFFQAFSQQIQADPAVFWEWWVYSWQDSLLNAWIPRGYFLIALFFCLLVILIRILPMGWKSKWKKITMWAILCLVPKHGGWSGKAVSGKRLCFRYRLWFLPT